MVPRVVVVIRPGLYAELLGIVLRADHRLQLLAVCTTAADARRDVELLAPDVMLVEHETVGEFDGIALATELTATQPGLGIVLLSTRFNPKCAARVGSGWSYLIKAERTTVETLAIGITSAAAGFTVSVWDRSHRGCDVLTATNADRGSAAWATRRPDHIRPLTERQLQVLELIAEGFSNATIGKRLFMTERTVSSHIAAIYRRLHISIDAEHNIRILAVRAYQQRRAYAQLSTLVEGLPTRSTGDGTAALIGTHHALD